MKDPLFYIKNSKKPVLWGGVSILFFLVILGVAVFLGLQRGKNVEIEPTGALSPGVPQEGGAALSALRGEPCPNGDKRPYAVMLAEDTVARPLSGISSADIVIEMPVLTRGINRMMALFQCAHPSEIGSVRSARHDFIPLAHSFDAILAHWGGSRFALDELKNGALDHIDALPNPFFAYYRKSGIPAPHNGFTSFDLLERAAQGLGYRTDSTTFTGYERKTKEPLDVKGVIRVKYPTLVSYEYEASSGQYLRFRGNLREKDALNQKQARADIVAVVFALSRQLDPEYNDVDIEGEGDLIIFQEGRRIEGKWKMASENIASPIGDREGSQRPPVSSGASRLDFFDIEGEGNPIPLVPGTLFIQIVEPGTVVSYP